MQKPPVPDPTLQAAAMTAAPVSGGVESYAEGGPQSSSPAANLSRILSSLRRFRWVILGTTVLGLAGGVAASRFIQPDYEVSANIWLETPSGGKMGAPIQAEELLVSRAWIELLRTFKVLDPVVQQQKLYLKYKDKSVAPLFAGFDLRGSFLPGQFTLTIQKDGRRYQLKQRNGMFSESGALTDSIGRTIGFRWAPKPDRKLWGKDIKFDIITPREASVQLVQRLVPNLREDKFLALTLRDKDPKVAERTLNLLIHRFVEEAADQKRRKLTALSTVLDTQVVNQAAKLKQAEEALEGYRVGTVTLPREDIPVASGLSLTSGSVYSNYFLQRTIVDSLRRDRQELADVKRKMTEGEFAVDAFMTIGAVRAAPDLSRVLGELSAAEAELRLLRTKYTEENRLVLDKIDRIEVLRNRTIPIYVDALLKQLENRQADLESRLGVASREMQQIPVRTQTEARLRREVDQAENLFRMLESSRQQARLAEASAIPDLSIVDSAVAPTRPSRNSGSSLILVGLLMGIGAGVGIAFLADRMDPRFRYPDQVSAGLGLPILGTIPEIKRAKGLTGSADEAAQVVEAFRSIRMSLAHSFDSSGPIALTVSSPSPGDGKSLISANLALSFAEAGYRTVLVDGDIRRGGLHHTFGAERRPGLVDHLAGEVSLGAILRPATHPQLTLIPCGSRRHLGPELLGSSRMRELMEGLKRDYQVIVVDSPPLGAGIDPFVLSTVTGHIALVLRVGETDRQLAEAKLQVLDRLPVKMLGAILNDVRLKEGAYKYYRYSYGYVAEEEPGSKALKSGSAAG